MKTHLKPSRPAGAKSGLAIIVVIVLLAVLTLLVVAFMLSSVTNKKISNTDIAMRQAESIAESAQANFIGDVLSEMKAGSTVIPLANGEIFDVTNPQDMVPKRAGAVKAGIENDVNFNSVIKQSGSGLLPFPGAPAALQRASNVSTGTPSAGGKSIAPESWAAPKLLFNNAIPNANQTPDWVYVARDGSNPTVFAAPNKTSIDRGVRKAQYVIGRYAYQAYDVSGLLDANVAGYGSGADPADISRKGSLLWADLSVLPGGSVTTRDGLADWRRPGGYSGAFSNLVEIYEREEGWKRAPETDNLFLSRADLLRYQEQNTGVIPNATIPFLTVGNKALNRPSWKPTINGTGTAFQYEANKNVPAAANRFVENVRVTTSFPRPRRDGTTAAVGEPLMKTRFPLSKLEAFVFNANDTATIEEYFGLTQAPSGPNVGPTTWVYRGSSNPGAILTLEQVAAAGREPDFFEVLKAGLLSGSLGNAMAASGAFEDTILDNNSDRQIFKIGANIIDQWDVDDEPTVIQYGVLNPVGVRAEDVAGIENLPYIHLIGDLRVGRDYRDGQAPTGATISNYFTFQLWNPNINPVLGNVAVGNFRIATAGTVSKTWESNRLPSPSVSIRSANINNDFISFATGPTQNFSSPTLLQPSSLGASANRPSIDSYIESSGSVEVLGFEFARLTHSFTTVSDRNQNVLSRGVNRRAITSVNFDRPLSICLQKNIGGQWVNYQVLPEWTGRIAYRADLLFQFILGPTGEYDNEDDFAGDRFGVLKDPRTTRYGMSLASSGGGAATPNNFHTNSTGRKNPLISRLGTGNGANPNLGFFAPPSNWETSDPGHTMDDFWNNRPSNEEGSGITVVHKDGVRRPTDLGDPLNSSITSGRPVVLNRPFRSVAEIGYAHRDEPWTSLNLYGDPDETNSVGDGALLDLFSLTENDSRKGVINLNSAPTEVLASMLKDTEVRSGTALTAADSLSLATAIRARLDATPITNSQEISKIIAAITRASSVDPLFDNENDRQIIAKAIGDVSETRTWNILIDVVAQSGRLTPAATDLSDFNVSSSVRYWYEISIDRITGEIVSISRSNFNN